MIGILPSIDIMAGKCVRLEEGDFTRKREYPDDPVALAGKYASLGFGRLHLVDLDGAREGRVVNTSILREIVRETGLKVDFGGGVKRLADLEKVFRAGASEVNLGSIAVTGPDRVVSWLEEFGAERFILSADVRGDRVAYRAWQEDSGMRVIEFIRRFEELGLKKIACTDAGRDGLMKGPSTALYRKLASTFSNLYIIASGGISGMEDIRELEGTGVGAAIIGRALYEKKGFLEALAEYIA